MRKKDYDNLKDKEERNYICGYCRYKFTQLVRSVGTGKSKVSSQVVCPACKNILKTWC